MGFGELLGDAAVLAASNFVVGIGSWTQGRKVRDITSLFINPNDTPEHIICGCSHAMSFHTDRFRGSCKWAKYSYNGTWVGGCGCQGFVADPNRTVSESTFDDGASIPKVRTERPMAPPKGGSLDLGKPR